MTLQCAEEALWIRHPSSGVKSLAVDMGPEPLIDETVAVGKRECQNGVLDWFKFLVLVNESTEFPCPVLGAHYQFGSSCRAGRKDAEVILI
jgi:hypothetical protein